MQITKNFKKQELECKCCKKLPWPGPRIANHLQLLRDKVSFPMVITSGYRCKKHNDKVGGHPNSHHTREDSLAVDVACEDSHERAKLLANAASCGFHGIGIAKDFVHLDMRDAAKACVWVY